jgi:uncharacterized protein
MITLELLREKASEIRAIAEKYGAENIRVFGSVARGEAREDSDVDLLVDWKVKDTGFDRLFLQEDLTEFLHIKVDISESNNLYWYVKDNILKEATNL